MALSVRQDGRNLAFTYLLLMLFNQTFFVFFAAPTIDSCENTFLSVGNDRLPDSALTASSTYGEGEWEGPHRGRLNTTVDSNGGGSWASASLDLSQWIQVNFTLR